MPNKAGKTCSEERAKEILAYAAVHGEDAAQDIYGIQQTTLRRYQREYPDDAAELTAVLKKIRDAYTEEELKAIAAGGHVRSSKYKPLIIKRTGTAHKFGVIGDTHIGAVHFEPEYLLQAFEVFEKDGIDTIFHVGDVVEGMSNRAGHVYELSHIGYAAQRDYAVELLSQWGGQWYMIDGNHDRWYIKSNGAKIVEDICNDLPDATFLGHDEGDVYINGVWVKLWHGEDGSSYATSYRLQKIIEAFTGGEKPQVLLAGHVHKAGYFPERNIHACLTGALCKQSKWMRSTRKANHTGYQVIEFTENEGGVARFKYEFLPFY